MMKKLAFTLAEVLITLAVIGIVAALTIGVFLPKIHSTIRARQIATAEVKFTKAMEQMALNNAIGPYYETTQEFVDELQNYLKISKVCDNEHFEDCFGYNKLHLTNGEEFELGEIKTGKNLGKTADGTEYLETVGLVTIDGTGMIVSWNKKCDILEPKVYKWDGNTNETTSCVAILMDINLDKSPNTQNKDIALFRAESIDSSCGIEFTVDSKKYCWSVAFAPTQITKSDCEENKEKLGIQNCHADNDYWAGAVKECGGTAKLPSLSDLSAFSDYIYGTSGTGSCQDRSDVTMNTTTLAKVSPELYAYYSQQLNPRFSLWSGVEYKNANQAYQRTYQDKQTWCNYYLAAYYISRADQRRAVCVIK